jgi:hypothetical protein
MHIAWDRSGRIVAGALLALGLLLDLVPAVAADPCLTEVPDTITATLMHRTIARLGLATQERLLAQVARRDDLDATQQDLISRYATISGPSPPPLEPMPAEPPVPAAVPALGLSLTDYRWNAEQGRRERGVDCANLTLRTPSDCPAGGSDIHNLVVGFLRTRHGLCGGPIAWTPSPEAHPLVAEVAAVLHDPAYYGSLESWLENDRDWSFRRPGNFFTLLYMDYLALAFEHGQINFALSELLGRRYDLRTAYPALDILSRQLALLKELDLIE